MQSAAPASLHHVLLDKLGHLGGPQPRATAPSAAVAVTHSTPAELAPRTAVRNPLTPPSHPRHAPSGLAQALRQPSAPPLGRRLSVGASVAGSVASDLSAASTRALLASRSPMQPQRQRFAGVEVAYRGGGLCVDCPRAAMLAAAEALHVLGDILPLVDLALRTASIGLLADYAYERPVVQDVDFTLKSLDTARCGSAVVSAAALSAQLAAPAAGAAVLITSQVVLVAGGVGLFLGAIKDSIEIVVACRLVAETHRQRATLQAAMANQEAPDLEVAAMARDAARALEQKERWAMSKLAAYVLMLVGLACMIASLFGAGLPVGLAIGIYALGLAVRLVLAWQTWQAQREAARFFHTLERQDESEQVASEELERAADAAALPEALPESPRSAPPTPTTPAAWEQQFERAANPHALVAQVAEILAHGGNQADYLTRVFGPVVALDGAAPAEDGAYGGEQERQAELIRRLVNVF